MKTSMTKVSAALALMALSGAAMAGISTTRHNLGSTNPAGNGTDDGTTEICVFCHTPHGSDTNGVSNSVPLWNRITTSGGTGFQRYSTLGTGTLDGSETTVGDISIACLSCHDGTQAMDVVLNAPGFGGQTTTAGINGPLGTSGWADGNQMDGTNSVGANLSGELVYIGTDLRNDHPISIQYGGGGLTSAGAGTPNDPDFNMPQTAMTTNGNKRIWWIETGGTPASKSKSDLPLYTRIGGVPYVECGSCHDPHVNNSTFLRMSGGNTGSQVCLACHNK